MLLDGERAKVGSAGMGKREPNSELQRQFVERLVEEMTQRDISDNALARASQGRISQTMISAIKRFDHDPTLEKVNAIADALGVPAWFLMTRQGEQRVITPPKNVVHLPSPYPKIFSRKPEEKSRLRPTGRRIKKT